MVCVRNCLLADDSLPQTAVGHTLVEAAETQGTHTPPEPTLPLVILLVPVFAILTLMLAKPVLGAIPLSDWLMQPSCGQFQFARVSPRD